MTRVVYCMNVSLDGYIETPDHGLDWATVDDELHSWFNDHERAADAFLYGRRVYELMAGHWPTAEADAAVTRAEVDFARIWVSKPKVVFSSTLSAVDWNSRLVAGDVGEVLDRLRDEFPGDVHVAGPTLASAFVARGLVDEYRLLVHPVILGAGTPFFPSLPTPIRLRLTERRSFASGVTLLAYSAA